MTDKIESSEFCGNVDASVTNWQTYVVALEKENDRLRSRVAGLEAAARIMLDAFTDDAIQDARVDLWNALLGRGDSGDEQ